MICVMCIQDKIISIAISRSVKAKHQIGLLVIDTACVLCLTTLNDAHEMMLANVSLRKECIKNGSSKFECVGAKWFLRVFSFPSHLCKERRDKQAAQE